MHADVAAKIGLIRPKAAPQLLRQDHTDWGAPGASHHSADWNAQGAAWAAAQGATAQATPAQAIAELAASQAAEQARAVVQARSLGSQSGVFNVFGAQHAVGSQPPPGQAASAAAAAADAHVGQWQAAYGQQGALFVQQVHQHHAQQAHAATYQAQLQAQIAQELQAQLARVWQGQR